MQYATECNKDKNVSENGNICVYYFNHCIDKIALLFCLFVWRELLLFHISEQSTEFFNFYVHW
jgi:hypothetical protein